MGLSHPHFSPRLSPPVHSHHSDIGPTTHLPSHLAPIFPSHLHLAPPSQLSSKPSAFETNAIQRVSWRRSDPCGQNGADQHLQVELESRSEVVHESVDEHVLFLSDGVAFVLRAATSQKYLNHGFLTEFRRDFFPGEWTFQNRAFPQNIDRSTSNSVEGEHSWAHHLPGPCWPRCCGQPLQMCLQPWTCLFATWCKGCSCAGVARFLSLNHKCCPYGRNRRLRQCQVCGRQHLCTTRENNNFTKHDIAWLDIKNCEGMMKSMCRCGCPADEDGLDEYP